MQKSEASGLTLFAVLIAGALFRTLPIGPIFWISSLAGLVLLVILFAYEGENQRTFWQSTGFAAVCGFCLLLAVGNLPILLAPQMQNSVYFSPLTWIAGSIL